MSHLRTSGGDAGARTPTPSEVRPPFGLSALLRAVPAILYIAEAGVHGQWEFVSPQIETILGFTAEEWCANRGLFLRQLHPDDRASTCEPEATDGAVALEYRLRHRDGHYIWIRDDALLIEGSDGIARWHGVLSDISDRRDAVAELEIRAAQQAAVARLGEQALRGASPTDLMQEAVSVTTELLGVEVGSVMELLPDDNALTIRAAHGVPDRAIGEVIPGGTGSQAGFTLLQGAPVVSDWATESRFTCSSRLRADGRRRAVTVLIEGRRGPFGVLGLYTSAPREFKAGDVDFVQAVANVLAAVIERQLTDEEIRHRALHDPLTGLPNRTLFVDRLEQATERLRRHANMLSAVLALDLDGFKLVNDSLGHKIGDELLAAAAPRLRRAIRSSDTVARFSGDEFGILLNDIAGEHEAVEMAQRIAAVFDHPFVLNGTEHFVTASIGIALAEGGSRVGDLLRDADAAMHRAKERGRARFELFDERLRGRAIQRLRVENDLRRAVERDELTLEYQPLVALPERRIVGVEALVRWDHPEHGRIPPGDFIPVAEENGLIERIGEWVLDRACAQGAWWHRHHPETPLSVSVNLSAVQLANPSLPATVDEAVRRSGIVPWALGLELTESVLVGDADELAQALRALKAVGVRLILDDFGTGYSSLSYLTRLPLDSLKVDRSFVAGLGVEARDTAVTEAIIAMSRALGMNVVGEGAENELQVEGLELLGCDVVQGYYFSKPVPAAEITQSLSTGPAWAPQAVGAAAPAQG